MPPKTRVLRNIDIKPPIKGGSAAGAGASASANVLPPARPAITEPLNLALATGVGYSSAAPTAYISATWDPPYDAIPQFYQVNVSTSSSFTASGTILGQAPTESARIDSLLPNTLYYVRVRAWAGGVAGAWSDTASITTAQDTTPAGVPTSISATWIGVGDLLVTWTNPTEANFKDVQVVVRASSGGTIYRTAFSAAARFLYTLAWNFSDTSGVGDSSLYVELRSRTFSNVLGTTVNTGLVTKAAPGTPASVTHTWSGETDHNGVAAADWSISWTRAEDAARYRVTIDSVAHQVVADTYTYPFALNKSEHSGTPDPVLSYSLVAVDGFGQVSTAVSGTATNEDPPTPTVTLTQGAVSGLYATIAGTKAADFLAYEVVWKRDGTTVATVEGADSFVRYEMQDAADIGYHSWTAVIRQKDMFGLYSSTVTSSAVAFEALTLSYLRDGIAYSDSISTAAATLKTAMADGVTASGGVSYNA